MTAVVGVIASDGVVFATDDQITSTAEGIIQTRVDKIAQINECFVVMAGKGNLGKEAINETLNAKKLGNADTPKKVCRILQSKASELYSSYEINPHQQHLIYILGGYDEGVPEMWALKSEQNFAPTLVNASPGGIFDPENYQIAGTPVSQGMWNVFWQSLDWTQVFSDQAALLMAAFIKILGEHDLGVGRDAYVATIPYEGELTITYTGEDEILAERIENFKSWFYDQVIRQEMIAKVDALLTES